MYQTPLATNHAANILIGQDPFHRVSESQDEGNLGGRMGDDRDDKGKCWGERSETMEETIGGYGGVAILCKDDGKIVGA